MFLLCALALASSSPVVVNGKIIESTSSRVYLDRGASDGLAPGTKVLLRKGRRTRARCKIDYVSRHRSSCKLKEPLSNEVTYFRAGALAEKREVEQRAPQPKAGAFSSQGVGFAKVEHKKTPAARVRRFTMPAEVGLRFSGATSGSSSTFAGATLYASVSGAELYYPGLKLYARGSLAALKQPDDARFRNGDAFRFELHEFAVAYRKPGGTFNGALGRFMPWHAPGVSVLDGAQGGVALFDDAFEFGAYGGALADAVTVGVAETLVGGAYWSAQKRRGSFRISNEGRLGVAQGNTTRLDGETHLRAAFKDRADVATGLRASFENKSAIELAYVQLSVSPADDLRVEADYRYRVRSLVNADVLGDDPQDALHSATLATDWLWAKFLSLRFATYANLAPVDEQWRLTFAPEVGLVNLMGDTLALYVGYQESTGTFYDRYLYSRAVLASRIGLYASGRVFAASSETNPDAFRAFGASLRFDQRIFENFRVFARGRGETSLPSLKGNAAVSSALFHLNGEFGISAQY